MFGLLFKRVRKRQRMSKSSLCSADTFLYANGVSLCVRCSEAIDAERKINKPSEPWIGIPKSGGAVGEEEAVGNGVR
jgi:hypothetical protein